VTENGEWSECWSSFLLQKSNSLNIMTKQTQGVESSVGYDENGFKGRPED